MLSKIVAIGALAIAVVVAFIIYTGPSGSALKGNSQVPQVKFVSFASDKDTIAVGQSATVSFNVQNSDSRNITGARMVTVIEPAGYQPYLRVDRPTIDLPALQNKDSRTGDMTVSITATAAPAKEATYTVRGILYVDGVQTDTDQFDLKITQS